jgi:hypothetical protein
MITPAEAKVARKLLGWSQEELAGMLFIGHDAVGRLREATAPLGMNSSRFSACSKRPASSLQTADPLACGSRLAPKIGSALVRTSFERVRRQLPCRSVIEGRFLGTDRPIE